MVVSRSDLAVDEKGRGAKVRLPERKEVRLQEHKQN